MQSVRHPKSQLPNKRQKAVSDASKRAIQADYKVWAACNKLVGGKAIGDAAHLTIVELVALISWRGGKVSPDKRKKEHKNELVQEWERLRPSHEELLARAGATPPPAGQQSAPSRSRRAQQQALSCDEDEDEDEDDDAGEGEWEEAEDDSDSADENGGEGDNIEEEEEEEEEEKEEEEEEEEEEENEFEIECILEQRGKGRHLKYLVKWKGYDDTTWESRTCLQNAAALDEWEAQSKWK